DVDARADIFALGVCAWELVCGRRLFRRVADEPEPVPSPRSVRADLPEELSAVIEKALERDPALRWPTAQSMPLAIETWLAAAGTAPSKIALAGWLRDLMGEDHAARRERLAQALPVAREATVPLGQGVAPAPPGNWRASLVAALDRFPWPDLRGSRSR